MTFLKNLYSSLYESESSSLMAEITSFLHNLDMPKVNPPIANGLDAPLTLEEIKFSIKAMQNNKTPGPDRFPVDFLKKCINK